MSIYTTVFAPENFENWIQTPVILFLLQVLNFFHRNLIIKLINQSIKLFVDKIANMITRSNSWQIIKKLLLHYMKWHEMILLWTKQVSIKHFSFDWFTSLFTISFFVLIWVPWLVYYVWIIHSSGETQKWKLLF